MLVFSNNKILTALNNSEWYFHLTGSRFFGDAHFSSDFDFFVQSPSSPKEREDQKEFLRKLGFECNTCSLYGDSKTVAVYQYLDDYGREYDIQIVEDAALKCKLQQTVRSNRKFMNIYRQLDDKLSKKDFWDLLYQASNLNAQNT